MAVTFGVHSCTPRGMSWPPTVVVTPSDTTTGPNGKLVGPYTLASAALAYVCVMPSGPNQYGLPPRASSFVDVGAVVHVVMALPTTPKTHAVHAELLPKGAKVPAAHAAHAVALPRP